jgi:hypothetical protein
MPTVRAQPRAPLAAAIWMAAREFMDAARVRARADDELTEARELLAYWEQRARSLPRWALMRRREAREAAARWRALVAEAERERYGGGVLGAVSQYALERRAPVSLAHRGRRAVRLTAYAAAATALTLVVAFMALVAAVAAAVVGAL